MAGSPQGGTTTNASNFSLNEDIKLPMGGRYQPTSSVGVFGGPRQATPNPNAQGFDSFRSNAGLPQPMPTGNGMMMDLNPESPTNGQMIPRNGPQQATQPNYDGTGMPIVGQIIDDYGDFVPPHLRQIDNQRRIGDGLSPRTDYGPETIEAYNAANPSNFRTMAQNNRPQGQSYSQPKALNSGVQQMAAPQQGGYNVNTASAQGLQQAQQGAAAGMGYRPMAIGAPSQANLQQYTNPYETQVVNQSLADLERSRLMAQNVGGAQASAANAFGGDRQGIAEAETNRAFADQAARTASGLRQTGYQNAQSMARQASIANQNAGLAGSQQRLNASNQLGNISNLGFGMGQTIQSRMDQQGAMQQALQQQLINAGKNQYAGYTGAPAQSLQYLLSAVGGAPPVGSVDKGYEPGLFDYLTLGLGV